MLVLHELEYLLYFRLVSQLFVEVSCDLHQSMARV